MYEIMDTLLQKRIFVTGGAFFVGNFLLISLLALPLQLHHANIMARISAAHTNQLSQDQVTYDSPNEVTNTLSLMTTGVGKAAGDTEVKVLSGAVAAATGVTHMDAGVGQGAYDSAALTFRAAKYTERGTFANIELTFRGVGLFSTATVHMFGDGFALAGDGISNTFGFVSGISNPGSVIRPVTDTPTPVITQIRIQQAALIQRGTMNVSVPSVPVGVGGACDSSEGNGGYPISWCNAPMDTVSTIPYSGDTINRECTSYAYWYFTSVEGFTNFRAWGNAKYWASTSNYPTRTSPVVGAIAVETVGAYGHVAIVQALPGQTYAGRAVPAGYVLVSEMNYDWNGHFRYSYSPLSKFSAYIYPAN
jgi:hypothetical protein